MVTGKVIFSQIIDYLPMHTFRRCVHRNRGHYKVQSFPFRDQYLCMDFAPLNYRESFGVIKACLCARVLRSTMAEAKEKRDWRICANLAQALIQIARRLYLQEDSCVEIDQTVYASSPY